MKTLRTVLFTLAVVVLFYGLFAIISLKTQAPIIERTMFQLFNGSGVIALIMGIAFLLIAIILTIALFAFKDDRREDDRFSIDAIDDDLEQDFDDDLAKDSLQDEPVEDVPFRRAKTSVPSLFDEDETNQSPQRQQHPLQTDTFSFRRPQRLQRQEPEQKPQTNAEPSQPETIESTSVFRAARQQTAQRTQPAADKKQGRCIYCGAALEDRTVYCPICGKKR